MDPALLAVVIPAAITLAGVIVAQAVKARADAVTGYAALCESLQTEHATLRQRLADVEARLDQEREAWTAERTVMTATISAQGDRIAEQDAKIAELEIDNRQLRAKIRALESRSNV